MANIVFVTMEFISAGIGLDQQNIRKTSFAKRSTIRLTITVRPKVATSLTRLNPICIIPPSDLALDPILGLEFKCTLCTRHALGALGRLAISVSGKIQNKKRNAERQH